MFIEAAITVACLNPFANYTFPKTEPECYQTITEEVVTTVPNPAWDFFKESPEGTVFFNNGGAQCVALSNHYIENMLGLPHVPIQSAYQLWTEYDRLPELYNHYNRSATPVEGSIVVMAGGEYNPTHGHTGVVVQANPDGTFISLEQNGELNLYTAAYSRTMNNVSGFLVPHNNIAVPEVVKSSKTTVMPYTGKYNER